MIRCHMYLYYLCNHCNIRIAQRVGEQCWLEKLQSSPEPVEVVLSQIYGPHQLLFCTSESVAKRTIQEIIHTLKNRAFEQPFLSLSTRMRCVLKTE